ncbi:MarR family winged helix-turn-helix transcriptional regulator [Micrococcoides hystricis]|uniref:MarR family winged helix-turn-helix transcriptional regulator n=1 Tax=Micrococcoides hystricis TaxID=1572761 RepID=A0ABV6P9R8_9MICC
MSEQKTEPGPLEPASDLLSSLFSLQRTTGFLFRTHSSQEDPPHHLQIMLGMIYRNQPIRARELVQYLAIGPGPCSRQIVELEDEQLIERAPDPEDARAQLIRTTEHGERVIQALVDRRRALFNRIFADWSTADLEQARTYLERVRDQVLLFQEDILDQPTSHPQPMQQEEEDA